jgi:hypothetical protein
MKLPKQSPLKQIRKQCIDCCCGCLKTIRFCCSTNCPLWYLRFGKHPETVIRENGKRYLPLFDKNNFKVGARFCPNKVVTSYEL